MARLIYCVQHSSGNSLPLRAQVNPKDFKPLFLDCGLMMRMLHLKLSHLIEDNIMLANRGAIAEQFVGQHLLGMNAYYEEPELFYWNREKRNSAAEVDYLVNLDGKIVPVEVKAGSIGRLKSLMYFAAEKEAHLGIRINAAPHSLTSVEKKLGSGKIGRFQLLSIPFYLITELHRLAETT